MSPAAGPLAARVRATLLSAAALALGAAVSLGLARFAYALLLPPMRADLGWSYFTAGAMNTVNAAGYLAGALAAPWAMRRARAATVFALGGLAAALLLALHGATRDDALLALLRFASGVASAAVFVSGGLMAARLGSRGDLAGSGITPGLVLGLYYGGTGLGIVASAALVPPLAGDTGEGWRWAWAALGLLALGCATVMALRTRRDAALEAAPPPPTAPGDAPGSGAARRFAPRDFAAGLAGYFAFGLGYIGYMTFVVTLLRQQAFAPGTVAAFYALLGVGVMASPWLWAGLLQRHRDGRPLATLNALLAAATALPVVWAHPVAAFASGALFGAVFLSVVASTTALVRHNLPPAAWPAGISAFTIVFAAGQIVGPSLVGALADGPGGLRAGLAVSAGVLLVGAVVALRQRGLADARAP